MRKLFRLHAKIHGKVQGVYYRAWTQQTAQSLGLTGWVRNLPGGQVELVAEGVQEKLQELQRLCHQGPPAARVEKIDEEWFEATAEFDGFQVLRPE